MCEHGCKNKKNGDVLQTQNSNFCLSANTAQLSISNVATRDKCRFIACPAHDITFTLSLEVELSDIQL